MRRTHRRGAQHRRGAPGEWVVAIGLGGVGLSVVAGARLIIAVDVSAEKAMLARAAVPPTSCRRVPVSRGIRALTGGRGADYAFECLGRADPIRSAWQSARRGGRCVVAGMGRRTIRWSSPRWSSSTSRGR
ncbi:zinc-binding dehydrogenase [Amycolatopsis sacchari]|uniref:zinc-binding dehydrogenase n=1 Tax=Amycolatopsis sacchari TaxID=115433 RepID=UPI003D751A55